MAVVDDDMGIRGAIGGGGGGGGEGMVGAAVLYMAGWLDSEWKRESKFHGMIVQCFK